MERKKKGKAAYMISAVAETYDIHPQTLRLYEREGLLKPSRSEGNTRLYTQEDLERLELILNLTRDLGVNLAGVEVILNMRKRLEEMQSEMQEFIEYVERELANRSPELNQKIHNALVKVTPPRVTLARPRKTERNENL
jgi:MerR family transcriptional regulator, heat shock protein HspR